MMSDIALMLEEIQNKLDELDHKVDIIHQKIDQLKILPQMSIWEDCSIVDKPVELEEIKPIEVFPYQISEDEYKNNSIYAKIEIIYYEVDGVFATFDGKLVKYLDEEYFGIDNLNSFKDCNTYLRDETIHVDYHMVYEGCTSYFAEYKGE